MQLHVLFHDIILYMFSVLIADDEQLIRDGIASILDWQNMGFSHVFKAQNAYEAISILSAESIDLLITDINMPGKTGIELLEWVSQNTPDTVIIVISGYDKFEYAQSALHYGAVDYILKPIRKNELIEKIQAIVKRIDDRQRQTGMRRHYERVFFFRKLLENSFIGAEELEEIKMCLEVPDTDGEKFFILLIDRYSDDNFDESSILDGFIYERIGIYSIGIIPSIQKSDIMKRIENLSLPHALGSEQNFDSLCISYKKALELLRGKDLSHVHSFNASFSDHKEMMNLLSYLSHGQYEAVDAYLVQLFPKFENASAAKHWCLWFMDCIEQYFEKYRFTGIYQEAVKSSRQEDIVQLQKIFQQYIQKVYMTFEEKVRSSSEIIVDEAKKIIADNIGDKNFSLTSLADTLQMSYGYFSSIFKQVTKQNFSDYLTAVRMQKAKELLSDHHMKLYEVADKCGYSSYRYFSECFKKYWKKSPSEFHR